MFQTDLLKRKRVLITGGGTGLGKSMGRRMIELGAELMICGRRAQVLKDTAKEFEDAFSCKVRTHVIDIRSAEAVDVLMDAAFADGPLDVLINNAAGNFIARTETLSHRAVDSILVLHGTTFARSLRASVGPPNAIAASSSALSLPSVFSLGYGPLRQRRASACRHVRVATPRAQGELRFPAVCPRLSRRS